MTWIGSCGVHMSSNEPRCKREPKWIYLTEMDAIASIRCKKHRYKFSMIQIYHYKEIEIDDYKAMQVVEG